MRLKAFFARQFLRMPQFEWAATYGPFAARLEGEILPRFNEQLLTDASEHVADEDAEIPLRPEETTR
jgi:hypothetical protein